MRWFLGFVNADPKYRGDHNLGWRIIRWFQGYPEHDLGKFVHVFLIFERFDATGSYFQVFETTDKYYNSRSLRQRSDGSALVIFKMERDGTKAMQYAENLYQTKTPYSYVEILGLGIVMYIEKLINTAIQPIRFFKPIKYFRFKKFKNWFNVKSMVYCVESTLDAGEKSGFITPWMGDHQSVDCPKLYDWMVKAGYKIVLSTVGQPITKIPNGL